MTNLFFRWYSHNTQLPWLLTMALLCPVFAYLAYFQFAWRSLWWMSGMCFGLTAFYLLTWMDEQVKYHTAEINKMGVHYINGKRYRLEADEWK